VDRILTRALTIPILVQRRWGVEFDLPPNNQMEPTRQFVCAIVALRRAAHLKRQTATMESTDRQNETSLAFR
jgi:hypothetical protein